MVGLALQGGGMRGSYQIGAYYALKKAKIKIDGVCGTSIGAFNGAMIACGKEKDLLTFWQNIDVGKILRYDKEYEKKRTKQEYDFHYFLLSIKNFFHILKMRGIPTDGLKEVLKTYIEPETLLQSNMDYGLCTVRVHDLKPLYIFKEDMKKDQVHDYILASCNLPLFKMEKKVDDHYYLDGGFYDNTPVNMLIEKGYKKIYVVELNPIINRKRKLTKEVEIIKITPKRSLGWVLNHDIENIRENIKMGYYDTLRVVKNLDGYYYCFKRRPNFFYTFLSRKIKKTEKKRLKNFFHATTDKEMVIKAMEYMMQNENIDYYQIYKPYKMLKKLKKKTKKNHFIYQFIQNLRFL